MSPKPRPEAPSPSEDVISMNLAEQTREVLATLTQREEQILRARFGVGEPPTEAEQEELGQDFEVTKARIQAIEARALAKLRSPGRSKTLKAFVDDEEEAKSDDEDDASG